MSQLFDNPCQAGPPKSSVARQNVFQSEKSSDNMSYEKNKVVIPEATPTFCILVRINQ